MATFTAAVDAIIAQTEKRLNALVKASVQEVVNIAQTPVAKGGKMRIDTGFLRASGQGSLTGLPTGPVRGDNNTPGFYDNGENNVTVLQLAELKLGVTFYFGWTANYAIYREAYDGFLESAVQQWPSIVAGVTAKIKQRIG